MEGATLTPVCTLPYPLHFLAGYRERAWQKDQIQHLLGVIHANFEIRFVTTHEDAQGNEVGHTNHRRSPPKQKVGHRSTRRGGPWGQDVPGGPGSMWPTGRVRSPPCFLRGLCSSLQDCLVCPAAFSMFSCMCARPDSFLGDLRCIHPRE